VVNPPKVLKGTKTPCGPQKAPLKIGTLRNPFGSWVKRTLPYLKEGLRKIRKIR